MLVLSRREDETIVIELPDGRIVQVMVTEIQGDKVRLGIVASRDIPVYRKEIYDHIIAQKQQEMNS